MACVVGLPLAGARAAPSQATFKFTGGISKFGEKLISGMVESGYTQEFSERTFGQLEGFGSSGFPEKGRIQREGEVVHLVAHQLSDLSAELASVGDRGGEFPLPHGRGDEFHHYNPTPDPREGKSRAARTRDIYIPDLHIDTIKVKTRDFR
jgi:hypothetical protein